MSKKSNGDTVDLTTIDACVKNDCDEVLFSTVIKRGVNSKVPAGKNFRNIAPVKKSLL
jgi:hypothetical protein